MDRNNENETSQDLHRQMEGSSSFFSAFMNLFKSLIGIGVLALPIAFSHSGCIAGLILLPVCAVGMLFVSNQMIHIADERRSNAKNLVEFIKETLPKGYEISVNVSLFCFQMGICISYVIFFIKYIQLSFCRLGDGFYCESKTLSVCISVSFLIPLIFIREMSKLKFVSLFANIITLLSLAVVGTNCLMTLNDQGEADVKQFNLTNIGKSIGVFIFTFEGIGVFFNIRHSMKQPDHFSRVLNVTITFAIILFCLIGFLGYLTFGNQVEDLILFNFSEDNIPIQIVEFAYCISLIFSYPIQIFPCLSIIDTKIKSYLESSNKSLSGPLLNDRKTTSNDTANELVNTNKESDKFFLYSTMTRLIMILFTLSIGLLFSKVSDFLSITGNVCGIYLCYTVPIIVVQYQNKCIPMQTQLLNIFILFVSTAFGVYGLYSTINQIRQEVA